MQYQRRHFIRLVQKGVMALSKHLLCIHCGSALFIYTFGVSTAVLAQQERCSSPVKLGILHVFKAACAKALTDAGFSW
jgi:hypothetical protein